MWTHCPKEMFGACREKPSRTALCIKILPVFSEASRVANPGSFSGSCAGARIEDSIRRVAERLVAHQRRTGGG